MFYFFSLLLIFFSLFISGGSIIFDVVCVLRLFGLAHGCANARSRTRTINYMLFHISVLYPSSSYPPNMNLINIFVFLLFLVWFLRLLPPNLNPTDLISKWVLSMKLYQCYVSCHFYWIFICCRCIYNSFTCYLFRIGIGKKSCHFRDYAIFSYLEKCFNRFVQCNLYTRTIWWSFVDYKRLSSPLASFVGPTQHGFALPISFFSTFSSICTQLNHIAKWKLALCMKTKWSLATSYLFLGLFPFSRIRPIIFLHRSHLFDFVHWHSGLFQTIMNMDFIKAYNES